MNEKDKSAWQRGQRHFDFLVSSYVDYYITVRSHQGAANRHPSDRWYDDVSWLAEDDKVVCHTRLGGLLRHYERRAA